MKISTKTPLVKMANITSALYQSIKNASLDNYYNSKLAGVGSTFSVVKIFPERFECYHIGDSTIKIYENATRIMKSENHNFSHPDTEILKTRKCGLEHPFRQTKNLDGNRRWRSNKRDLVSKST